MAPTDLYHFSQANRPRVLCAVGVGITVCLMSVILFAFHGIGMLIVMLVTDASVVGRVMSFALLTGTTLSLFGAASRRSTLSRKLFLSGMIILAAVTALPVLGSLDPLAVVTSIPFWISWSLTIFLSRRSWWRKRQVQPPQEARGFPVA